MLTWPGRGAGLGAGDFFQIPGRWAVTRENLLAAGRGALGMGEPSPGPLHAVCAPYSQDGGRPAEALSGREQPVRLSGDTLAVTVSETREKRDRQAAFPELLGVIGAWQHRSAKLFLWT